MSRERPTPMPADPQGNPEQAVEALEERIAEDKHDEQERESGENAPDSPAGKEPPD